MKYYKRLKTYKASNVEFNPETMIATSYNWWIFVKIIKGKLVFNDYRYSMSTSGHQRKVRYLLRDLGIKIDVEVNQRPSLSDGVKVDHLYQRLFEMQIHNANKKTRKKYSKWSFDNIMTEIRIARSLGAKFSRQLQKELKKVCLENEKQRLARLAEQLKERKIIRELEKQTIEMTVKNETAFNFLNEVQSV